MADNLPAAYEKTPVYSLARGVFNVLFHTVYPLRWHNVERARDMQPPYIIMGNHKSFADPLALAVPIRQYEIRYLGKQELAGKKWSNRLMRSLHMIPVARHATDMGAMRACMQVLREGHILGIFPEGTRHQETMMQEVESGAALIALRARVPLLPVYIDGKIRPFHVTHVYYGEPMPLDDLIARGVNTETVNLLCERIRDTFYRMRDEAHREK